MSTTDATTPRTQQRPRDAAELSAPESPTTLAGAAQHFFAYSSPRFLAVALTIVLPVRFALAGWTVWDAALVAAIWLVWPIQEWLIHVFMLHFEPLRLGRWTIDFEVPRSHRIHHRNPWNLEILFIPMQGYLIGMPPLVLLSFGLLPTAQLALTAVAFYLMLTTRYEWVHYLVHTRYRPRSGYFRRLWRNHRLHHCKNERYWYGVTMLAGDTLLGTAPQVGDVSTSDTCRSLGIEAT